MITFIFSYYDEVLTTAMSGSHQTHKKTERHKRITSKFKDKIVSIKTCWMANVVATTGLPPY